MKDPSAGTGHCSGRKTKQRTSPIRILIVIAHETRRQNEDSRETELHVEDETAFMQYRWFGKGTAILDRSAGDDREQI